MRFKLAFLHQAALLCYEGSQPQTGWLHTQQAILLYTVCNYFGKYLVPIYTKNINCLGHLHLCTQFQQTAQYTISYSGSLLRRFKMRTILGLAMLRPFAAS